MIRAIVKNGVLYPLGPLPPTWTEGQELELTGAVVSPDDPAGIERWYEEMAQLTAERDDLESWKRIEETLADRIAKDQMRRERGQP
jgi:hypothetical protein